MNMRIIFLLIGALALISSCQTTTTDGTESSDGWEVLIKEDLSNWKGYNQDETAGWKVEDGILFASGTGSDESGYIITRKQYDNFELHWEWKIAEEGNSGVLYHVMEAKHFETPYVTGPEYQLLDDVGFPPPLEEWQLTGADYAMYVADKEKKKLKPVGKWNSSKIIFDNGHVEHWLNGEKIVEFEAWTEEWFALKNSGKWENAPEYGLSSTGHLCLQDHGSKVWFKNMKIKELPKKEQAEENLFNGENLDGWNAYGTELWYVEDGLLVCESGPDKQYGYLATDKYYKDFDLTVDFKQLSNGNSGIFFRSSVDGTRVSGWQVEVAPQGYDSGGIYESYGRGWLNQIPDEKENILKPGEWNTMRIKVVGSEVTTWLNGEEMTYLDDPKIGKANGRIALQIHDGGGIKVLWKNLVVKPL